MTLTNTTPELARAAMMATISSLPFEHIDLHQALGATLAHDIIATRDHPPFRASAMDGYAVRARDCTADLILIGESAAGAGFAGTVGERQCVRIFTGAPVPDGTDAVVIQEDVQAKGDLICVPATAANKHIRDRGIDFKSGACLLKAGTRLDPIALALIAATGRDSVRVTRRPIVAILSGGDEIVSPGTSPSPFQVFDSITSGLSALLNIWGAHVINFAPQRDTIEALEAGFQTALAQADLVVTVGGASVGDHDLMKPALARFSPTFVVDKIAVRPGKPTWFATTQMGPVLGLPGNPASALVCAHLFLAPLIARLSGQTAQSNGGAAKLARALPSNGPREHYLRAVKRIDETGQLLITALEDQDSALLSVFQAANALILCPPNATALEIGETVRFIDLRR